MNRPYIVKGLLLAGQVGMFAGPSNMGKSSISACLAAHVAMGREVGGMRVHRSAVLYVAAEDAEGIQERAYPFMKDAPTGTAPFEVFDMALDMQNECEIEEFGEYAISFRDHWGCDRLLIIIDTLNLSMPDGDENSARDTGQVVRNAQQLAKSTGAHVLIIHHVGTNDSGRPRGSSALTANIDTLLTMQPAEGNSAENAVFVVQSKQRRIQKGAPIAFRIDPFEVGHDDDGDLISFPMAVPFEPGSSLTPAQPGKRAGRRQTATNEKAEDILRVLRDLSGKNRAQWHNATTIRDLTGTPFSDARRKSSDALRKAVKRALDALFAAGDIEMNSGGEYRFASPLFEASAGTDERILH
nr:AAA family ATPase [Aliiroseovarius lamellibrachiae]